MVVSYYHVQPYGCYCSTEALNAFYNYFQRYHPKEESACTRTKTYNVVYIIWLTS